MQKKKLIIIGASGHGKVVADIALLNGYKDIVDALEKDYKLPCNTDGKGEAYQKRI